jgi:hypothetical protein
MKFNAPLVVLLLVALVCGTSAASRGRMLLSCEDDCNKGFENNVAKCIAKTDLGKPPQPMTVSLCQGCAHAAASAFVAPTKTAFELADTECRRLQAGELNKCKAACAPPAPDCADVAAKCRSVFKEGTLLEIYCRKEKNC